MDSSVVTTAQMCLCTTRRSWAMGTEPCRREMQSILRSFKAPKGPRRPTSRKTAAERLHGIMKLAGRLCPLPAIFVLGLEAPGWLCLAKQLAARKRLHVRLLVRGATAGGRSILIG